MISSCLIGKKKYVIEYLGNKDAMNREMAIEEKVRIDKWLWAARFYKTRSLASQAVNGGHVHLNGKRVKAARAVQVGDALHIRRGLTEFDVVVEDLSSRRGPAELARELYRETGESILRRQQAVQRRRSEEPAAGTVREPQAAPERRRQTSIRTT